MIPRGCEFDFELFCHVLYGGKHIKIPAPLPQSTQVKCYLIHKKSESLSDTQKESQLLLFSIDRFPLNGISFHFSWFQKSSPFCFLPPAAGFIALTFSAVKYQQQRSRCERCRQTVRTPSWPMWIYHRERESPHL